MRLHKKKTSNEVQRNRPIGEVGLWSAVFERAFDDADSLSERARKDLGVWNEYLFRVSVLELKSWAHPKNESVGSMRFCCDVMDLSFEYAVKNFRARLPKRTIHLAAFAKPNTSKVQGEI